jgi:hypothetical protein
MGAESAACGAPAAGVVVLVQSYGCSTCTGSSTSTTGTACTGAITAGTTADKY